MLLPQDGDNDVVDTGQVDDNPYPTTVNDKTMTRQLQQRGEDVHNDPNAMHIQYATQQRHITSYVSTTSLHLQ